MNPRLLPRYTTGSLSLFHPGALHKLISLNRNWLTKGHLSFHLLLNKRREDMSLFA